MFRASDISRIDQSRPVTSGDAMATGTHTLECSVVDPLTDFVATTSATVRVVRLFVPPPTISLSAPAQVGTLGAAEGGIVVFSVSSPNGTPACQVGGSPFASVGVLPVGAPRSSAA